MPSNPGHSSPSAALSALPHGLADKDVLVVGGSSGIGAAAVRQLGELGANVTVASRNPVAPAGVPTVRLDVLDQASVAAAFGDASFDHLIVTAAQVPAGPLATTAVDDVLAAVETRVTAAYRLAQAAIDHVRAGGSLTFFSGVFASRPAPGTAMAAASLGGIEAMTRALALELAPVRVNVVRPGNTDTPLLRGFLGSQEALDQLAAGLPLGRIGRAEEVAAAALMCAANPYMTGSVVLVDGGASLA